MSYKTRGKDLLGGSLPNIYIQNIELSVSSETNKNKTDNPHIITGRKSVNYSSKLFKESSTSGAMKINLNMSIKFSNLNPLLESIEASKYTKIMVLQCVSKSQHDRINANPFTYFSGLIKNINQRDFASGPIKTKIIPITQMLTTEYNRSLGINLMGNTMVEDNERVLPYSLSNAADSTSFYSIPIKSEFFIGESEGGTERSFLSYFVFAFHDKEQEILDLGRRSSSSQLADMFSIGKISSEIALNNKNVNKRAFAFKDNRGMFWNGPVHQMSNGQWMKYSSHSGGSDDSYLTIVRTNNVKIRDNRIYNKLASLKFDLLGSTDYITDNKQLIDQLRNSSNLDLIKKKDNFFSDFYITRDKRNAARFMFSVNMGELVKRNTDFPKILDNMKAVDINNYQRVIEQTKIKNISIRRDRITSHQTLTSQASKMSIAEDQETVVVAHSADSDSGGRGLLTRINDNSSRDPSGNNLKPKTFGVIGEVFLGTPTQNKGIRHFTGADFDISSKRDGEYSYSLEIEAEDAVIPFIKSQLSSLQTIIEGSSTSPGFEQYYKDSLEKQTYYDPLVEQFNPSFLNFYNQKYNSNVNENFASNNFLFRGIGFMTRLYFQLSDEIKSKGLTEVSILNYLTNISSPATGSPDGIQKVLQLMYSLEKTLKGLISKNTRYVKYNADVTSEAIASNPSVESTRSDRSFAISHTFKNKFNAMTDPNIGYDFLFSTKDQEENNIDGLTLLSKEELDQRFSIETSKYFTSNNSEIEIRDKNGDIYNKGDKIDNTKYSFLTVSNIFLRQEDKDVSFSNINSSLKSVDGSALNDILTQASLINQNKGLFYGNKTLPNVDRTEQNLIENFSVFQGAAIGNSRKARRNSTSSRNFVFSKQSESDRIDEGENLFSKEQREKSARPMPEGTKALLSTINQVSKENFLSDDNSISYYFVNDDEGAQTFKNQLVSNSDRNRNSTTGQNINRSPELNRAPNQIKALLLSLLKSESVNKSSIFNNVGDQISDSEDSFRRPLNAGLVFFNYKNIRKVEAFRGFENQRDIASIKSPLWTALDKSDLDKVNRGQSILCRHIPYVNNTYGVPENSNLSLPTYNEFFFVSQDSRNQDTTEKGEFILQTELGSSRISSAGVSRLGSKINQFFTERANTTDPILSKELEAIRPEFMNSNVVIKGINLTKVGIRDTVAEGEERKSRMENETKTALVLAEEVRKAGFGRFLPTNFKATAFNFAEVASSDQGGQTTRTTGNNGGGASTY